MMFLSQSKPQIIKLMKKGGTKIETIKHKPILILDFGSQYTQLIGRRLRDMGVYCEIHSYKLDADYIDILEPVGIILSGGPATVTIDENPRIPNWVFTLGIPILGICYGMQAMALQLGGLVTNSEKSEFGNAKLLVNNKDSIFADISFEELNKFNVWMSHGDKVTILPPNFENIAVTDNTPIAAMQNKLKKWFGVQFHPEVTHTENGLKILHNFVINICHAATDWNSKSIIENSINQIKSEVGSERVLLGLSGGVDSSVAAALLHKAIGKQLICVFVDTGLLRLNEVENVKDILQKQEGIEIVWVDAQDKFLKELENIDCPEEKRKTIGRVFIEVFANEAKNHKDVKWLAQGTIYSDVIESAAVSTHAGSAEVIKSHHNVGGLPKELPFKLLEPLRELFKDEVRNIGLELGLPKESVYRHPFPGVGLGIRVLGKIEKKYLDILRRADAIFIEELCKADLYYKVSQAFAVFLPVKSVGVKGDGRHYDYVIALRAVETTDFMTAHWANLPFDFLANVSNRIINEIKGISRVVYDISGKPPSTIEWE